MMDAMAMGVAGRSNSRDGVIALTAVSVVVVVVTVGFAHGLWIENLHNGLLALAFTSVGAYVLHQQPRNRCGSVFLATGLVEAVMFLGRQVAHDAPAGASPWWGWLGVWPLVVGLFGATVSVILFPDGRPPSPAWQWVLRVGAVVAASVALTAALWPVGYATADVTMPAPFDLPGTDAVEHVWTPVSRIAFAAFQVLWVVAVAARWRKSSDTVRRQVVVLGAAAALSVAALIVGVVGWGSPTAGVLTACLVPVAAGWAIVHGQYLATRSALSWLTRRSDDTDALPTEFAAAVAGSLGARQVTLWIRRDGRLHPVGVWPSSAEPSGPLTDAEMAQHSDLIRRSIRSGDTALGELTVDRSVPLSRHEYQLLEGYCAQAALVVEHLTMRSTLAGRSASGGLDHLTPREQEVLGLMSKGLTNAAICDELHLSKKTVEPVIGSIFIKLGLPPDSDSNRRVLAVRAYLDDERAAAPH